MRLVGEAKFWYETNRDQINTWDEFLQKFTDTFIIEEDPTTKWKKMVDRVQKRDERLAMYFHEKVKLCADLQFMDKELEIREDSSAPADKNKEHINQRRTSKPYLPARNEDSKPLCFACEKYGHVSKYCSENQKLFKSNAEMTPKPQVSSLAISNGNSSADPNLKYFQKTTLNGSPIKSYVDLGSQCVMIRKADANEFNINMEQLAKPIQIKGFGEGVIKPLGKFSALLKVDQAETETEILVVPNVCQKIPLIIRQLFTEQEHIVLVRKGNVLRIFHDDQPDDDSLHKNVPRGILELDENAETNIPLINITGSEIKVKENEKIFRGEECEEVTERRSCTARIDT
ncbi:hypothetical protein Trydic_g22168 [Trypoxylus dichotomus]